MQRREFLKMMASASAVTTVSSVSAAGKKAADPETVSGRVSMPGRRDASGVIVTNGRDCTLTNEKGEYTLPVYEGMRFVSVTVPSGYRVEWPHVAYPRRWGNYNFNLSKWAPSAKRGCSFVHIADSEISGITAYEKRWAGHVKRVADREDAAFIVHTGDICRRRGLLSHFQLMNADTMGRPVIYCIGNHDLEVGPYGEQLFESLYGPTWYSFEAGGVHFVVTPMPFGDYRPSYTHDQVADWIRNDLALVKKGTPVVFFNHMISNCSGSAKEVGLTFGDSRRIRLDELCNLAGFVYGHVHFNLFRRVGENGRTAFVSTGNPDMGGIGHSPVSTRVLRADANGRLTSKLVYGLEDESWRQERAGALWEAKLEAPVLFGEPLVADGRVLVGVSDEDGMGTGAVEAFDAESGRRLWRTPVGGSIHNRMVVAAGNVIAQDTLGRVHAFRLRDGSPAWSYAGFGHTWLATYSGLITDGKSVICGTPLRMAALDAATGAALWTEKNDKLRIGEASSDTPAMADGVLVFASNWRALYGYDAAKGTILWSRKDEEPFRFPGATPVIDDGKVYWLGGDAFYELDLRTGKTLRKAEIGACLQVTTKVLVLPDAFVFGSTAKGLVVLDRKTLEIRRTLLPGKTLVDFAPYSRREGQDVGTAPVPLGGNLVAATAGDGAIHVWDVATGKETRKIFTGSPYLAGVTVSDGRFYAADLAGMLRAFAI